MLAQRKDITYEGVSYRINCPEGTAFIFINEDKFGKICHIDFQIGKAGSQIKAWSSALCGMINLGFERGTITPYDLITEFISVTHDKGNRVTRTERGYITARSAVEAIGLAIDIHIKDRGKFMNERAYLNNSEEEDQGSLDIDLDLDELDLDDET